MKPRFAPGRGNAHRSRIPTWLIAGILAVAGTAGSQAIPRIGYVYPAGGQAGSSFEISVGGQGLDDPLGIVCVDGVGGEVLDHFKLLPADVRQEIGEKAQEVGDAVRQMLNSQQMSGEQLLAEAKRLMDNAGITEKNLVQLREFSDRLRNPKRQQNNQIGETVRLKVKVAPSVAPGLYFIRLLTASGLSNPMRFAIGQHPEVEENDPWPFSVLGYFGAGAGFDDVGPSNDRFERVYTPLPPQKMPVTINGRILPGEVDEYSFHAKQGDRVVVALLARNLVPYLADAVPGWFQAVISLHDSKDVELGFADDFRNDPDPVLFYKIPQDGEYRVKIHDSIYRGREDFVYRLTVGQLPFLTGVYPLGAKAGSVLDLNFQGGNLDERVLKRYQVPAAEGLINLFATSGSLQSNAIPFHVDEVDEELERENNDTKGSLNEVSSPGVVNGTLSKPGDVDFFRVKGGHSKTTIFEVFARRLGSPLDATLTVYDSSGKQIAYNDDFENPLAGLTTHHADSRVVATVPGGGSYYVRVADRLGQGSIFHHYRLKVTPGRPVVGLRVAPSSVTARPGGSAGLTVHALRLDGWEGDISLSLKDAPEGFAMGACTIPAKEAKVNLSVSVPNRPTEWPVALKLQGTVDVNGRPMEIDVVPAEDMMQAFAYRHLVPVDALLVDVRNPPPPREKRRP